MLPRQMHGHFTFGNVESAGGYRATNGLILAQACVMMVFSLGVEQHFPATEASVLARHLERFYNLLHSQVSDVTDGSCACGTSAASLVELLAA